MPGGTFRMGSDGFYPEERPVREVSVEGFWIDSHAVTMAEFRRFVEATGHVTWAERAPEAAEYPDADPELLVPGSLVFRGRRARSTCATSATGGAGRPGADWRHPEGPESRLGGRELHPVTHVAYADALAYAEWAGKSLPTEAEWEYAARGGLDGATYTWGDEFAPKGRMMANTWQGEFPWQNLLLDGYEGTSPVETFPPNGYGLYDMAGNVWEWTVDLSGRRPRRRRPRAARRESLPPTASPASTIPRRVIKGGSHLCAPNYCLRYRPAARQGETVDTTTGHIGFRCVVRPELLAPNRVNSEASRLIRRLPACSSVSDGRTAWRSGQPLLL